MVFVIVFRLYCPGRLPLAAPGVLSDSLDTLVLDLNCGAWLIVVAMNTFETTPPTHQPTTPGGLPAKPVQSLAVTSIGLGIPITAICLGTTGGGTSGIVSMLIAWGGIASVNLADTRRR